MAKAKGPRKVRRYDNAFTVKAVKLSQLPGVQVKDVSASLDIHPFMLSKWRKQVRDGVLSAEDDVIVEPRSAAELRRLRKIETEHERLEQA